MVILIDNYDSFTYNIVHLVGEFTREILVIRNDDRSVEEILELHPTHIILSPGPGYPKDAGICEELIQKVKGRIPVLGICLGHQAVCETFGGRIDRAKHLIHGKKTAIHIANGSCIFQGLAPLIEGARYHSLVAQKDTLPDDLLIIAEDDEGEIMGVKHRNYDIYGLQFHPESILTNGWRNQGKKSTGAMIIKNFLKIGGAR